MPRRPVLVFQYIVRGCKTSYCAQMMVHLHSEQQEWQPAGASPRRCSRLGCLLVCLQVGTQGGSSLLTGALLHAA